MNTKFASSILLLIPAAMVLSSCIAGPQTKIEADPLVIKKVADFSGDHSEVFPSSGFGNGGPFNVEWSANDAKVADGELHLSIHKNAEGRDYPWTGGEMRSKHFYGYGDFSVRMKPAKTPGTASTFFTYTGEWDSEKLHPSSGEGDTRNPDNEQGVHDEIDIEFLGKDTTKVQFNYFTAGQGGNEYYYDLGFDASLEYHTYGFRWERERITWFVDDKPVYQATKNIPTHPGRIISNYWCASESAVGWMGSFDGKDTKDATYQWFGSTSDAKETHKEEPKPSESSSSEGGQPASGWDDIAVTDFDLLACDDVYTAKVSDDKKALDVTYTSVPKESYKNLSVDIVESLRNSNALRFEVENKGETTVQVRADVNAATTHGANNITAINTSATLDGNSVYTDTSWGGSKFDLVPGQKSVVVVNYDGVPTNLMFMIDSAIYQDGVDTHAGHVEFKNLKVRTAGEPVGPSSSEETSGEPEESSLEPAESSDVEESSEGSEEVVYTQLNFGSNDTYTCVNADGKSTITYESVDDNSYQNVFTNIEGIGENDNCMTLDFKNDGDESVQINVEIGTNGASLQSHVVNPQGDYDWYDEGAHRAQYNIVAGATRSLTFRFDPLAGEINYMLVFINSCWAQVPTTHINGNMTISNVHFFVD